MTDSLKICDPVQRRRRRRPPERRPGTTGTGPWQPTGFLCFDSVPIPVVHRDHEQSRRYRGAQAAGYHVSLHSDRGTDCGIARAAAGPWQRPLPGIRLGCQLIGSETHPAQPEPSEPMRQPASHSKLDLGFPQPPPGQFIQINQGVNWPWPRRQAGGQDSVGGTSRTRKLVTSQARPGQLIHGGLSEGHAQRPTVITGKLSVTSHVQVTT